MKLLEHIQDQKIQAENLLLLCPTFPLADDRTRYTIMELEGELWTLIAFENLVRGYQYKYKVQLYVEEN